VGWKKGKNGEIIKLRIPLFSRRVSPLGSRKCRAEVAIVEDITLNGKSLSECNGQHENAPAYRVGEFVSGRNYDASLTVECTHGIHFFISRYEAENYN
jgi:hypothetical protein